VTRMPGGRRLALRAALLLLIPPALPALAEKADKDKPTQIESDRMSSDDARRITIFEGKVVLTKGTILVHADRIVVHTDADGFQYATATGNPVTFRQKGDPKDGKEGVWTDGEAQRVEIDERNEHIELFDHARVTRDQDVVRGDYIFLDQRTQFFSVSSGKGAPAPTDARVKAVIQPKTQAAPPKAPAGAAPKPEAPASK